MTRTLKVCRQGAEKDTAAPTADTARSILVVLICRPFDLVAQQLLELGEAWFQDTVRWAGLAAACGGSRPVRVRLSWPSRQPGLLRLPMEWEVVGDPAHRIVSGELQVRPVGGAETQIELTMGIAPADAPRDAGRGPLEEAPNAMQSFLRGLFWTLEALSHYDLHDPGA